MKQETLNAETPISQSLAMSQAAIQALPLETLSAIFCWVTENPDEGGWQNQDKGSYPYPHIQTLAVVCTKWRQVVWSTPQLWSQIYIHFPSPDVHARASLLKLFLENCGALPLTLELRYDPGKTYDEIEQAFVHPSVDDLLLSVLDRVAVLHLENSPLISSWLSQIPKLVKLNSLRLVDDEELPSGALQLSNIPSLSSLYLIATFDKVVLPQKNLITTLVLGSLPTTICVQILFQCPNLESYLMHSPEEPLDPIIDDPGSVITDVVTFPNLHTFAWDCSDSNFLDDLVLRYIHTPVLRHLCWTEILEEMWSDGIGPFLPFCQSFPASPIKTLILRTNCADDRTLDYLASSLQEVETIGITGLDFSSIVDSLMRQNGPQPSWPFPKMKELLIDGFAYEGRTEVDVGESVRFVTALASRAAALDETICVHLAGVILHWDFVVYPGPLHGGEKLIIREGRYSTGTVPTWYHALLPGIERLERTRSKAENVLLNFAYSH